MWIIRLNIKEGDLLILSGGLRHRASQPRNKNNKIIKDVNTGYYVDLNDCIGKIMLQWEFTAQNERAKIVRLSGEKAFWATASFIEQNWLKECAESDAVNAGRLPLSAR